MKSNNKWSSKWKSSRDPAKQRLYVLKSPLHIKGNLIKSGLSKELRKTIGCKSARVRKGDTVKILRGANKGKSGKVSQVSTDTRKVFIENIQITKKDGNKVGIGFDASNLQITDVDSDNQMRFKRITKGDKS